MKLCYPIIRYREHGEIGAHSGLKIRRREASVQVGCSHQLSVILSEHAWYLLAEGKLRYSFTIVLCTGAVRFSLHPTADHLL